ncbi:MAG TPA: hypothetical protein VKP30_15000 [Polyangiaceae bacterium]|nr:hypothetical protein [Polyangiaceae bacterium]
MNDPLADVTRALRETTDGEESGAGRFTRARVLAAVRVRRRRRVLNVTFGIPLAAILIGSGAWAASGETFPVFVQRVSSALGLSRTTDDAPTKGAPHSPARAKAAVAPPKTSTATDVDALDAGTTAQTEDAPEQPPEPSMTPPRTPEMVSGQAAAATSVSPRAAASTPRDSAVTERELRLYENAHRAHFVTRDYGEALTAWNEYLKQAPQGRFAVEASYNRALCLVRLGRTSEAQRALTPFAHGVYGGYRKAEAQALLEKLSGFSQP